MVKSRFCTMRLPDNVPPITGKRPARLAGRG